MYYFKYAFFPYIVLFIIVITNLCKAIYAYKNHSDSSGTTFSIIDLGIGILCGIAMGAGLLFQGVLADNNAKGYMVWSNSLILISVTSFIVFIANVVFVVKKKSSCLK